MGMDTVLVWKLLLVVLVLVLVLAVLVVLMWGAMCSTNTGNASQTTTARSKSFRPRMDILAVLDTLPCQTMTLLTRATTTQKIIRSRRHIRLHR